MEKDTKKRRCDTQDEAEAEMREESDGCFSTQDAPFAPCLPARHTASTRPSLVTHQLLRLPSSLRRPGKMTERHRRRAVDRAGTLNVGTHNKRAWRGRRTVSMPNGGAQCGAAIHLAIPWGIARMIKDALGVDVVYRAHA